MMNAKLDNASLCHIACHVAYIILKSRHHRLLNVTWYFIVSCNGEIDFSQNFISNRYNINKVRCFTNIFIEISLSIIGYTCMPIEIYFICFPVFGFVNELLHSHTAWTVWSRLISSAQISKCLTSICTPRPLTAYVYTYWMMWVS